MERSTLIILAVVCILLFIAPLIMYSGLGEDEGYFGGSDDAASEQIEATNYEPWFSSIWEPPSGEIESLLFALQAAIGAIIIGYFFGYWRGQGKEE
ncbi:energy-coupling factor ABC transporter substrate-binding protein [Methanobrevibacter sp.]|uniref:energy-coupling factor ABC transporter substrate-binding protein n=1 Tax=Methanobrevibacter sp. TaxID=66852 RepID=UPI0025DBB4EE|nr:energy-coupling factor ABC transporter substrate-binding protein [Methanobrevibacter sp.]MBQ2962093.1 energy-coupling factor ABC transporter substrate-binding protein [Methanobrevibacter sp.]